MTNRLADPRRQHAISAVNTVIDAIAHHDRWTIARHCTGQLLTDLLSGAHKLTFRNRHSMTRVGFDGVPIVAVDENAAIVIGGVDQGAKLPPIPVAAVLITSSAHPHFWLVASLAMETAMDIDLQRAVQFGQFSEDQDARIIAAHSPLDPITVSIDWDNPDFVLHATENSTVTVRDALTELATFDREAWPWLADECPTFSGRYLRARHPELVRRRSHREP